MISLRDHHAVTPPPPPKKKNSDLRESHGSYLRGLKIRKSIFYTEKSHPCTTPALRTERMVVSGVDSEVSCEQQMALHASEIAVSARFHT